MAEFSINSPEELEAWLQDSPREWAQVIAVRAAHRMLPLAEDIHYVDENFLSVRDKQTVILSVLRSNLIARAVVQYPDREWGNYTGAAAASAANAVKIAEAAGIPEMLEPVSSREKSALLEDTAISNQRARFSAAFDSIRAASETIASLASNDQSRLVRTAIDTVTRISSITEVPNDDATALANGLSPEELIRHPLWLSSRPEWFRRAYNRFDKNIRELGGDWPLWSGWLGRRIAGENTAGLPDDLAEKLDIQIATQSDDWWSRDPNEVNDEIAEWIVGVRESAGSGADKSSEDDTKQQETTSEAITDSVDAEKEKQDDTEIDPDASEPDGGSKPKDDTDQAELTSETSFLSDVHDPNVDYLQRAEIAFVLAGRINQIWDEMTGEGGKNPDRDSEGDQDSDNGFDSAKWTGFWPKKREAALQPGFVIHVDAPWGGGKTSFAGLLTRILNPYRWGGSDPDWMKDLPLKDKKFWPERFHRPWMIVNFNAWKHQHITPPWWVFYQSIRSQCLQALRTETDEPAVSGEDRKSRPQSPEGEFGYPSWDVRQAKWFEHWVVEFAWRIWTPEFRNSVIALIFILFASVALFWSGLIKADTKVAELSTGGMLGLVVTVLLGGGQSIRTVMTAFTASLLPGTPKAAENYSLGSGDPLERFRKHFQRTMKRFKRPVLVVVDDIDRCEPDFVVELIRGMQTILASKRVVYLILGDRDWIEKAFSNAHETMSGIDVGPEHEFGGRFVEKAIQFSLVLPDVSRDDRKSYLRQILGLPNAKTDAVGENVVSDKLSELPDEPIVEFQSELESVLAEEESMTRDARAQTLQRRIDFEFTGTEDAKKQIKRSVDRRLSLRTAGDVSALRATRHRLEAISSVLPPNPRQIKRIVNAITLVQEIARIRRGTEPGGAEWQKLALWTVLMVEWPSSWFTISKFPGLADKIGDENAETQFSLPESGVEELLAKLKASKDVMAILNFSSEDSDWGSIQIDGETVNWLSEILPPTSGKLIDGSEGEPEKPEGNGEG